MARSFLRYRFHFDENRSPDSLAPDSAIHFRWNGPILSIIPKILWARAGYEYFRRRHPIYEIAQFYPRMAIYTDVDGWLTKEFLGSGEFATEFGDFEVEITVPADHIVGSTGELQNPEEVLTRYQKTI